ncbi:MAG: hypothetical protein D6702_01970 [Planctomycetota bacterium]|nr:MAG: hypothetical protein D6702_01970 [Planctomycetota bacterium]
MNEREPSPPARGAPSPRTARIEALSSSPLEGDSLVLNPGSYLFRSDRPLRLRLVEDGRERIVRLIRSGPGEDGRMNLILQPEPETGRDA